MNVTDFDYVLPPELIAQAPAETRDGSRLLVVERHGDGLWDRRFADLPELLQPGDCVVVNDSRVVPARVMAETVPGAAPVELLFVEPVDGGRWRALVKPGRRCKPAATLRAGGEGGARLRVVAVDEDGARVVERVDGSIETLMDAHGTPPLPPYIARHAKPGPEDLERYQTVYAREPGSIAAPTAGLHFTPELIARLRARGIEVHSVTLHVGPATFRPMKSATVEGHVLPPERATVPEATAHAVNAAKAEGRRVIAVGTTTTRTLESAAAGDGRLRPTAGAADLFIVPGHRFRVVDGLVTNFHLPRSSLLVLVAAFAGRQRVLRAYAHAVRERYRFYSYGDATLLL